MPLFLHTILGPDYYDTYPGNINTRRYDAFCTPGIRLTRSELHALLSVCKQRTSNFVWDTYDSIEGVEPPTRRAGKSKR